MSERGVFPSEITDSAKARMTSAEAPVDGKCGTPKDRPTSAEPVPRSLAPLRPHEVWRACAALYGQDTADATTAHLRRLEGIVNYLNQCGDVAGLESRPC
jgi:hypothetical protein